MTAASGKAEGGAGKVDESALKECPFCGGAVEDVGGGAIWHKERGQGFFGKCPIGHIGIGYGQWQTRGAESSHLATAAANGPGEALAVVCSDCHGAGTVEAMTTHLGPDDHKYDAECPKCGGTGAVELPASTPQPGMVTVPRDTFPYEPCVTPNLCRQAGFCRQDNGCTSRAVTEASQTSAGTKPFAWHRNYRNHHEMLFQIKRPNGGGWEPVFKLPVSHCEMEGGYE